MDAGERGRGAEFSYQIGENQESGPSLLKLYDPRRTIGTIGGSVVRKIDRLFTAEF